MSAVVDASVVLAWLQDEPGSNDAEAMLVDGVIGAANWSEVMQKGQQHGVAMELVARLLASFGLRVADVTRRDGERAADLWGSGSGLSLGDRLCLALALRLDLPVGTTDRRWRDIAGAPRVILVR